MKRERRESLMEGGEVLRRRVVILLSQWSASREEGGDVPGPGDTFYRLSVQT